MVGLGETAREVFKTMKDLRSAGVRVLTIGQYLSPSAYHAPVFEYIRPEVFEEYRQAGIDTGFTIVESGPLVRSSYRAWKHVL
jgi:lipoic acid synthetase